MSEQTKEQLVGYLHSQTLHKATCELCREEEHIVEDHFDSEDLSPEAFAKHLLDLGWREIDSEEYGMICLCCPACVEAQTRVKGKLTEGKA